MQVLPNFSFTKPYQFLHRIKYGGVVGKKASIAHATFIFLTVAALCLIGKATSILAIVAVGLFVFFYALNSIDKTIKDNPKLALTDGSEIVRIAEIEAGMKGVSVVPVQVPGPNPFIDIPLQIHGDQK